MNLRGLAIALTTLALIGLVSPGLAAPWPGTGRNPWPGSGERGVSRPFHPVIELPLGGRRILGHYRVVAHYGVPGNPHLGTLGSGTAEQAAQRVLRTASAYRGYGLPVQPAMEIIATVAQGSPGADGTYSRAVPRTALAPYLAAAHRHRMLVVLDLQPGRSTFLRQARALGRLLLDPSVGVGLDPEWKVGPGQRPGHGLIGSSTAADVNATIDDLAQVVAARRLPDKLVVVHQFTLAMLPDRQRIRPARGTEVVFHADGFGTPSAKTSVFRHLAFPGRPFGVGFKVFLTQDPNRMTPRQVMGLRPRPDVVTYQ